MNKLVGNNAIIFDYIKSKIKNDNDEPLIYSTEFHELGINDNSLSTSIKRMCEKQIIYLNFFKGGIGGFSQYKINEKFLTSLGSSTTEKSVLFDKTRDQGFIYLFECTDTSNTKFLKIGWELNEEIKRDKGLQTGNPFEIKPIYKIKGSIKAEKYLHKKFKHLHFRGEWFSYNQEILDLFTNPLAIELIENLTK